jgi:uncharacterized Tic20 family protein
MKKKQQEPRTPRRSSQSEKYRPDSIVKIIAPIFLLLAIILISKKNITGNAVNNLNFTGTIPIVVILIISLVFVIAAGIKRKR